MIPQTLIRSNFLKLANRSKYCAFSTQTQSISVEPDWDHAIPFDRIPGPKITEILFKSLPGGEYHGIQLEDLNRIMRKKYGDLFRFPGMLGRKPIIMSFDPAVFEKVFRTEGQWPTRRSLDTFVYYRKNVRPDLFGKTGGLLTENGEKWFNARSKVNPVLLQPKTVKMYVGKTDEVTRDFIDQIRDLRDPETLEMPNSFGKNLKHWALESIGVIALDQRIGALRGDSAESCKIANLVNEFFALSYALEVSPSLWRYYKTKSFKRLMAVFDEITEIIMKHIDDAVKRLEASNKLSSDRSDRSVLEKLLEINREIAIVMAFDMLMAGVDTTSSALTSCLYHLAKNPAKQEILREEILKILPEHSSKLSNESLNRIPYMRACLKEAMRMNPVVTGTAREAGQDLVLNGYQIPKGVDIAMSMIVLQKSDVFFSKSDEFVPERWMKTDGNDSAKINPFVFLPFGFGVRSCIGRRFAEMEIYVALSRIFREFKLEYNHGPLKYKISMILSPDDDLKFKVTDIEK